MGYGARLKPKILKMMKRFGGDPDHLETNLLVDVYQSSFSLHEQSISVKLSDCLQLTNMLHTSRRALALAVTF